MTEPSDALRPAIPKMPLSWHCIRCKRDFPFRPTSPMPYAVQTETDAKGKRTIVGEICEECCQPTPRSASDD